MQCRNADDDTEAGIEKVMVTGVEEAIPHNNGQDEDGVEEEFITYEETMETEELVQSEQEEKRTFVITGMNTVVQTLSAVGRALLIISYH